MSDFNILNRSHSESDIYVSQFNNLTVSSLDKKNFNNFRSSCSSIVRRIYMEEVFCSNGKQTGNMIRKYSLIDMEYAPKERKLEENNDEAVEEVPMEVDISFSNEQFSNIMESDELVSLPRLRKVNDFEHNDETDCESMHILPERTKPRVIHINPIKKIYKWNIPVFITFIIISITCLIFSTNLTIFTVNSEIQLEHIRNDLKLNIHGHKNLIDRFIHILDKRENWSDKLQIISFIGSQGRYSKKVD
ncbi:uncharacterized protein LOC130896639 isoform X3 [Diorhabda carinulata]|uniref:uncharacterized protein LOC130896639 isoform X3 n=1 Tax=Diorhabda carinulata TaxID=1163345 RepID=UPI0025A011B1|nr:uncharacterized protein LOC130896639 isoform X3 [Diorhabda carinulata]